MERALLERADAVIEAMPAASGYDGGLSTAMRSRRAERASDRAR